METKERVFCSRCEWYLPIISNFFNAGTLSYACAHPTNIKKIKYDNHSIVKTTVKKKAKKLNKNNACPNFKAR